MEKSGVGVSGGRLEITVVAVFVIRTLVKSVFSSIARMASRRFSPISPSLKLVEIFSAISRTRSDWLALTCSCSRTTFSMKLTKRTTPSVLIASMGTIMFSTNRMAKSYGLMNRSSMILRKISQNTTVTAASSQRWSKWFE